MYFFKLILGLVLLVSVNARNLYQWDDEGVIRPLTYRGRPWVTISEEDPFDRQPDVNLPGSYLYVGPRVRRDVQGSVTLKSDGAVGTEVRVPIAHNDRNVISASGSLDLNGQLQPAGHGVGLHLDNIEGHGLSVTHDTTPGFGKSLTAAGNYNIMNKAPHDLNARAFVTRNMPDFPNAPNFNTVGGGLNYMYDKKIGASLGMAHTPFLDRKDYSAMGNLNVFHSPTSSVDFSAGFKKFDTPFMKSNWEPNFALTFRRSFGNF